MTDYIDTWAIKNELITRLRNADIFSKTLRGVTTANDTGTWAAPATHLIARNNIRNIRSITLDASPLSFGLDYDVDYTYDDSGTTKCLITLKTTQNGDYDIEYDYGNDKIYHEWPQPGLKISEYPRMAVDLMPSPTVPGGMGNVNLTDIGWQITVFAKGTRATEEWITLVRKWIIENQKSFYYLKDPVKPRGMGPMLANPKDTGKNKIFNKSAEFNSPFNYEKNN